ncbi:MAG: hypothetical protein HQ582_22285 [Planctomycetes bacterium]|nr:hypothetical protein [Planctomycetota bacterium]
MSDHSVLDKVTYSRIDDFLRVASATVAKAQDESRRQGVRNVYSINGRIHFELPSGELSATDPYANGPNGT